MKSKIKSLVLFTGLVLSSISSLEAGFCDEKFNPLNRKVARLKDSAAPWPAEKISAKKQAKLVASFRKDIARAHSLSAKISEELLTETAPTHRGALLFLQGELSLAIGGICHQVTLNGSTLSHEEGRQEKNSQKIARDYFKDAQKAFELKIKPNDSDEFQKICDSEDGNLVVRYGQSLRHLIDLTSNTEKKFTYLTQLTDFARELTKGKEQVQGQFTCLTNTGGDQELHYSLRFHPEKVVDAIEFEKNWMKTPQEGISYAEELTKHLNLKVK